MDVSKGTDDDDEDDVDCVICHRTIFVNKVTYQIHTATTHVT